MIFSFYKKIVIQVQRMIDHAWRTLSGLPLARRSMITPQLYLGGQYGLRGIDDMERMGITAIVSMRETSPITERLTQFKVLHLPTKDLTPPSIEDLQRGIAFIDEEVKKGGKVYVHCHYGEGRGASMVIAYLMSTGITYDDAFSLVQKIRTFIRPTAPQVLRLKELEKIIMATQKVL